MPTKRLIKSSSVIKIHSSLVINMPIRSFYSPSLLFDGEVITVCVMAALWPISLTRALVSPPHWAPNDSGADVKFKLCQHFTRMTFFCRFLTCYRDQTSELGLWRREGRGKKYISDLLKETLHWPIKEWKISPCKPMTIILTGPLSSDLFQPFSLKCLNVSWRPADPVG